MDFSEALVHVKAGRRVTFSGWMLPFGFIPFISLTPLAISVPAEKIWSPHNRRHAESLGGFVEVLGAITKVNAQGSIMMGWTPSQEEMLAEDGWQLLADEIITVKVR